jgi:hypothetical protein
MNAPWSHTSLTQFRNCPKAYYHKYVAKDLPFVQTPEMLRGIAVHEALEARLAERAPLPEDMAAYEKYAVALLARGGIAGVEMKMAVTVRGTPTPYWAGDVWGRGKADVVVVKGHNAFILDWKTGKRREDPSELDTFAYLLKALLPGLVQIRGAYIWLKEDQVGETHALDPRRAYHTIAGTVASIEDCEERGVWAPTPSGLCPWCPVTTCQHWREKK